MSEESQPKVNLPAAPKPHGPRRRGHRGGRGRRRPAPPAAPISESIATGREFPAPVEASKPAVPPQRIQRADDSAIRQAAEEASEIVESLRQTLAQMEEVLELIELAESQKLADEREVESLRRALRQIQSRRPD